MKRSIVFLVLLLAFSCNSYAGGPMYTLDMQEVKLVEKPKTVPVEFAFDDLNNISKHWTIGIGFGGNPLIGMVEKDGFGYPKCEYGVTCLLGYGYTWITGQPTQQQLKNALESIRSKYGAFVEEKKLASMVRDEVGIKELNYVEFGTVAAILPINFEVGRMWIINDNVRTRFGFGSPTIVSLGISLDF